MPRPLQFPAKQFLGAGSGVLPRNPSDSPTPGTPAHRSCSPGSRATQRARGIFPAMCQSPHPGRCEAPRMSGSLTAQSASMFLACLSWWRQRTAAASRARRAMRLSDRCRARCPQIPKRRIDPGRRARIRKVCLKSRLRLGGHRPAAAGETLKTKGPWRRTSGRESWLWSRWATKRSNSSRSVRSQAPSLAHARWINWRTSPSGDRGMFPCLYGSFTLISAGKRAIM